MVAPPASTRLAGVDYAVFKTAIQDLFQPVRSFLFYLLKQI